MEQVHGIFDSHAHYDDDAFAENRAETIEKIHANGVCNVVNIGCNLASSRFAVALAEEYDWFYAAAGFHPGNADGLTDKDFEELKAIASHPKIVAIGEIGLDYHFNSDNKEQQRAVFRRQIELAQKKRLPIIIHSRDATEDTLSIVREYPANGVVHCFSGSAETAAELVRIGYYIGFTGVVTFPNAQKARKAVAAIPMERILLETDAPYMAPVPFRGKTCTSDLIRYTAAAIAEVKGLPVQEVIDRARENTKRLFGIA